MRVRKVLVSLCRRRKGSGIGSLFGYARFSGRGERVDLTKGLYIYTYTELKNYIVDNELYGVGANGRRETD